MYFTQQTNISVEMYEKRIGKNLDRRSNKKNFLNSIFVQGLKMPFIRS